MELNFDKEIEALLRQAARNDEFVSANSPAHLDADEIAAFAENALPEKTRAAYTMHLADCGDCRTALSNVILLNREAETQAAAAAAAPDIVEGKTSWYQRFFAMPNLAYTLGGLALLFGGFLGFLVLQSGYNSSPELSQVSESERVSGPHLGSEIYNSNMAISTNAANMSPINSESNSAIIMPNTRSANVPVSAANTTAATPVPELLAKENRDDQRQISEERNETKARSGDKKIENNKDTESDQLILRKSEPSRAAAAPNKPASPPSVAAGRSEMQDEAKSEKLEVMPKNENPADTTRQISGKTFKYKNAVWYDAAYRGQTTTNIRRNSDAYRKLDSGLRLIAESLEGTVVVLWKEKAYRIQ